MRRVGIICLVLILALALSSVLFACAGVRAASLPEEAPSAAASDEGAAATSDLAGSSSTSALDGGSSNNAAMDGGNGSNEGAAGTQSAASSESSDSLSAADGGAKAGGSECAKHVYSLSLKKCIRCGSTTTSLKQGDLVAYGEYPQTKMVGDVTFTGVTDSRGYYRGSDGSYYHKTNMGYYKVEPIAWQIVTKGSGELLLICDKILDGMPFETPIDNGNANDYYRSSSNADGTTVMLCDVRAYLTGAFFNQAFNATEQSKMSDFYTSGLYKDSKLVSRVRVDSAIKEKGDKVTLPSYEDITKSWSSQLFLSATEADANRCKNVTDFALSKGVWRSNDSNTPENDGSSYKQPGYWWLRSPYDGTSSNVRVVTYQGYAEHMQYAMCNYCGIVPMILVKG